MPDRKHSAKHTSLKIDKTFKAHLDMLKAAAELFSLKAKQADNPALKEASQSLERIREKLIDKLSMIQDGSSLSLVWSRDETGEN